MANPQSLTQGEWKVLRELVGRQQDPDKKVAERLGMAPSNFAVIKRKLIEKGVLQEQIRVNLHRIPDAKVVAFVWIEYNQPLRGKVKNDFDMATPQFPTAYFYAAPDWSLYVDYFKSFEDAENARLKRAEILRQKAKQYLSNYMWKTVPISHLTTCQTKKRFVDYCLSGHTSYIDLANCGQGNDAEFPSQESPAKLNDTEKKALIAFRKYPDLKKSEIAKKIGVQQSSLSEVFKALQRKGVINFVRTFEPSMLPGRDVAAFAWIELKQPALGDEMKRAVNDFINKTPQVLRISYTRTFVLAMSFFESLDAAENAHLAMLNAFGNNVSTFNFKTLPCSHLKSVHVPYFLEHMFGLSV